jgi:hypothetical protein
VDHFLLSFRLFAIVLSYLLPFTTFVRFVDIGGIVDRHCLNFDYSLVSSDCSWKICCNKAFIYGHFVKYFPVQFETSIRSFCLFISRGYGVLRHFQQ